MPNILTVVCATKKIKSKGWTRTKFCNNKIPITLQYNVWSLFKTHLTEVHPLYIIPESGDTVFKEIQNSYYLK